MAVEKRCSKCSAVINKVDKFCHHCGNRLPQDINEVVAEGE